MTIQIVADHFKQNVDWNRFANLVASIGGQFDESQWRFLKARIFENSLQTYSDGSVKYVGEEGCDLLVDTKQMKNVRVEMKFIRNAFFSPKRMKMKDVCHLSLMSSQGTNKHKNLPSHYADYLLVVSNNCAGLIDKKSLMKYTTMRGDGIIAIVPSIKMNMLFTPFSIGKSKIYNIDLRGAIDSAIQKVIEKVK
jgi:hypothetical protein